MLDNNAHICDGIGDDTNVSPRSSPCILHTAKIRSAISRHSLLLIARDGKTGTGDSHGPTKSESAEWAWAVYD